MADDIRKLPDSELEVMQVIWQHEPPVARADVERDITERRPMAQTTLLTLITRLAEKGFLIIEKNGRASSYTPLIARSDYLAAQSRRFIDKLTREELDELRELLGRGEL